MNELIKQLAEQAKLQPYYDAQEGQIEKFAELILANADKLKQMTSTDLVSRPFELDAKFIKLCALNGPRRRQTYDDQDFQDLVDINGKSIPHVSKLRKQKAK